MRRKKSNPTSLRDRAKNVLLYRVAPGNGGLVFAPKDIAHYIDHLYRALKTARTWGEFRALIPRREYSRVIQASFDNMGERRPKSTDRFDPEQVAGWSDGDYPDWLQQEMDYYLPEDLLRQFGSRQSSVINGSFWMIPAENAKAMITALKARGFTVRSAPRLQFH